MIRRLLVLGIIVGVALAAVAGTLAVRYHAFTSSTLIPENGDSQRIVVEAGSSFGQVARELAERGLVERAILYRVMARLQGKAGHIQSGEYDIEPGMSPQALLDRMVRGEVVQYSLTIVEGWNFRELMAAVHGHEALRRTLEDSSGEAVMAALGHPEQHPEGRFSPIPTVFPGAPRMLSSCAAPMRR
jgi:UPF0755 protein